MQWHHSAWAVRAATLAALALLGVDGRRTGRPIEQDPEEPWKRHVRTALGLRAKWVGGGLAAAVAASVADDCAGLCVVDLLSSWSSGSLLAKQNMTYADFARDFKVVARLADDGEAFTGSSLRLEALELAHKTKQSLAPSTDAVLRPSSAQEFYRVAPQAIGELGAVEGEIAKRLPKDGQSSSKVDNHIHHSAMMTGHELLSFIGRTLRNGPDVEGIRAFLAKDAKDQKTAQAFEKLVELAQRDGLTMTQLDVFADHFVAFKRFDVFNNKYNPFKLAALRKVFLKPSYSIMVDGRKKRYFAEMTMEVCSSMNKLYFPEWRLSIYGRNHGEWDALYDFFTYESVDKQLKSGKPLTVLAACEGKVRWMAQTPRLFHMWKNIPDFFSWLSNIFAPAMMAEETSHALFVLRQLSGFDSVDDESSARVNELGETSESVLRSAPGKVTQRDTKLPYGFYMYHMSLGIELLNRLHNQTLRLRPHCGESGQMDHLATSFLLASQIQHGVQLGKNPLLQYLYYLAEVPVSVSLSSNHRLFVPIQSSPFGQLFRRGLFVSLSTDDPLIFFVVQNSASQCLDFEYALAEMMFGLSLVDLAEIARNSVLMSAYPDAWKIKEVGSTRRLSTDAYVAGVPDARQVFRCNMVTEELSFLKFNETGCFDGAPAL